MRPDDHDAEKDEEHEGHQSEARKVHVAQHRTESLTGGDGNRDMFIQNISLKLLQRRYLLHVVVYLLVDITILN